MLNCIGRLFFFLLLYARVCPIGAGKKAAVLKFDLCEFVAATSFNLKRHKTTVHTNKCDVCAFVATDSSDLLEHKKVHDEMILEGGETFPCNPICIRFK